MTKYVWESEKEIYGRYPVVYKMGEVCSVCNESTDTLTIDTSDFEYLEFVCCLTCFTRLISPADLATPQLGHTSERDKS